MENYYKVAHQCSVDTTKTYSTSFSIAIQLLGKPIRRAIYDIYGFVRLADEVVDTFDGYPQREMLNELREQTWTALSRGISTNPILQSFQRTVNEYNIDRRLIESFLHSMEMDLDIKNYNQQEISKYIYGSAEVVGLMCLKVFCKGDEKAYQELKYSAQKLGEAFQKVNFLRDLKDDYETRSRHYFPGVSFNNFNEEAKNRLIADIRNDFQEAYKGIIRLDNDARPGVHCAYLYYMQLLENIEQTKAIELLSRRIRVSNYKKFQILFPVWVRQQVLR
ncbi:MAG: phytoene/squalene synthase family protein [Bacteroidales bacterium]